jgi:hypothetical protein
MSDFDQLAELFSWVSFQPHYVAWGRKYDGWTVAAKKSDGSCYYVTAPSPEEAAHRMLAKHSRKVIVIKR